MIIIGAALPEKWLPHLFSYRNDKYVHALAFGLLTATWLIALRPRISSLHLGLITATLLCLASAFGIEWLQDLVPSRHRDALDLKAGIQGISIVAGLWWLIMGARQLWHKWS